MKIAIISRNPKLYSPSRMIEEAEAKGHEVRVIDPLLCYMTIASQRPTIHYKGEELTGFRGDHPENRCLDHLLWHGGCPPVRDDECL